VQKSACKLNAVGGVDFLDCLDFQSLTTKLGLAKESYDERGKAFFLIFMSPCAEMKFWGPKQRKIWF
jgi:hypothetical protein